MSERLNDGTVFISSVDGKSAERCRDIIEAMTAEVKVGKIYDGKVVSIAYAVPAAPATFTIMSTAAAIYLVAAVISARGHQPRLALAAP